MAISAGDSVSGLRGTYLVEARHGEGSFGVTYRATDRAGSPVILKELRVEKLRDWKALELFEREGEVLATLSHPNVPAFRDFFAHGNAAALPVSEASSYDGPSPLSLVLVQQFIQGTTLQQHLDRAQPLPPDEAQRILRALLGALRYLHERDPPLVHRDIKPGNIILTSDDRPYLVDFGAVQNRLRGADSVGSTIVGTLGYMPLEQLRGQALPSSDLYALGMTIVVALAGQPPEQLPIDEASGKVAIDRVIPAGTPRELRHALDAMIEVLASHRLRSAADALARLDAASGREGEGEDEESGEGGRRAPVALSKRCPTCAKENKRDAHRCSRCSHVFAREEEAGEAGPSGGSPLTEALRLHALWLEGSPSGRRADFSGARLDQADLSAARLSKAILSNTSLVQAQLSGTDLSDADLSGADLTQANFAGATLDGANLSMANLTQARGVDLTGARFWRATLTQADIVRGSLLRRFVASLSVGGVFVMLAVAAPIGVVIAQNWGAASGPAWDREGDRPVVVSTPAGDVLVARLRGAGKDDRLFVGAFDGTTAHARWKAGPFGTYSQAHKWTRFVVDDRHVVVTDFHAKAHILDVATGEEQHTISLTGRVEGTGNLWLVPPDRAGIRPVDGRVIVVDLAKGTSTEAPTPAGGMSPAPGPQAAGGPDVKKLPQISGLVPRSALEDGGAIVACYHAAPGVPTSTIVGVEPATATVRWQLPLAAVAPSSLVNSYYDYDQIVRGDRFVGVYAAQQWHVTAIDTRTGGRQWDVALRTIASFNGDPVVVLSASRVYVGREFSIEVRDASTGMLLGLVGATENYR